VEEPHFDVGVVDLEELFGEPVDHLGRVREKFCDSNQRDYYPQPPRPSTSAPRWPLDWLSDQQLGNSTREGRLHVG
jgi:hypothetical protein